jgi:hypothetical protein
MPRATTEERSDRSGEEWTRTLQRQKDIDTRWTDIWQTLSQYTSAGANTPMPGDDNIAYAEMSRITKDLQDNGTFRDMAVDQYLDRVYGARILGNPSSTKLVMAIKWAITPLQLEASGALTLFRWRYLDNAGRMQQSAKDTVEASGRIWYGATPSVVVTEATPQQEQHTDGEPDDNMFLHPTTCG